MIDTKALRSRVLDLAIQGKLTEQLESDGTAEELWQQIQAEKQRLIKVGKLKKEKPLPEISEDEIPFEIPENWKWVYLGEIFQHNTGKALNSANTDGKMLEYITTSNVYWDRFELKSLKQMCFTDDEIEKCTITKGDLLICEGGDIGRSAIWCFDYDMRIQNHLHRLRGYISEINAKYYYYLMMLYKDKGMIDGRGIGLQGFSSKRVHSLIVPLPPLAEQKRIVSRVEEIFRLLDIIDAAQEQYAADAESLKAKLITLGIQGRLTEQLASDGTAEELYQQIQAEKQRLIKEGKIKREKPLPEISEDEIPFDIPENWKWVRLKTVLLSASTGPFGSMLHKSDYVEKGVPLINPADIVNSTVSTRKIKKVAFQKAEEMRSYRLVKGNIVIGRRGEMGRSAIITEAEEGFLCGTGCFFIMPSDGLFAPYFIRLLQTNEMRECLRQGSVGSTMDNLNHSILENLPIPLPPLAEQKRIAEMLERVLDVLG